MNGKQVKRTKLVATVKTQGFKPTDYEVKYGQKVVQDASAGLNSDGTVPTRTVRTAHIKLTGSCIRKVHKQCKRVFLSLNHVQKGAIKKCVK